MLPRTTRARALLALGLLPLSASCAPDDVVRPRASIDQPSTDVMGAAGTAGPEFYVAPTGSPIGDGSYTNPWDLATALSAPATVTPGSIIWLRGGTYVNPADPRGYISTLTGTADAPIVVRQYPGERATVTNILVARGAHTWYWGFEVTNPAQEEFQPLHGVDVRGPGTKLINLVIHDATESGIYIAPEAAGAEVAGSIVYNNGRLDHYTHGIYCKSETATLLLKDNIVFDNRAYGIKCYANDGPYIQNIDLEGNVSFNNYVWGVPWDADILVGGLFPASGITVNDNYTYRTDNANTMTADIGEYSVTNQDVVLTNNYFVGGFWRMGAWTTATVTRNALDNFTTGGMVWALGSLSGQRWSDNTFYGDSTAVAWKHDSNDVTTYADWLTQTGLVDPGTFAGEAPTGVKVVMRRNDYEPGRANITVYNWAQESTISVDVSGVLRIGDRYVVQNAQDVYGPPVASAVYTGAPLQLPMVRLTSPSPIGVDPAPPAPVTGPTFNVFVLERTKPGLCTPDEDGSVQGCVDWHEQSDPRSSTRRARASRAER